jgi:methyltransferase family protein
MLCSGVADLDMSIPALEGLFDVIVFGDVLAHLKNPLQVLITMTKYLRRDGMIVISVPNIAHVCVRLQLLRGKFEYADRGILDRTHLRFFTYASLQEFIRQAGLKIMTLCCTPVPLSLIISERYQVAIFKAVNALKAALARNWKGAFAYQFVLVTSRSEANEA